MRALEYALGPRARCDLRSLLRHWSQPAPDILFAAGSQVDLQWVIPIYEAATARGLNCAFAGPRLVVPAGAAYADITVHALRFARARILVTATSGLTAARMPRRCPRRVAIPHSLVSLHMAYPPGTFDAYTDVFCCGLHHRAEIEAMNRRDRRTDRRAVLVGYGKFERLATTRPPGLAGARSRLHVLLGPSWGPGNILETMGERLLRRLLAEGFQVTLRPHPSFFIDGNGTLDGIVAAFASNPAFALENSIDESRALWTADLMIADYSGFAMEFAFIRERPVLYVDVPPKVLNPHWRELDLVPLELSVRERIGVSVPPDVEKVVAGLVQLARAPGQWAERIREERSRCWVNFGSFGEVSSNELACMLAES